jgi:formate dehydrogenase major subunit
MTALAHVIVTEKLYDEAFIRERCDWDEFEDYAEFVSDVRHSPEMTEMLTGVPAEELRAAARLYATGGNGAIYYGLGVTEHSQGSTTVMGIANLAMLTGNIGRDGVGVNPLRGQNNVQGSCDMGSFPHELPGYRHVKNADVRAIFEQRLGRGDRPRAGPAASPTCWTRPWRVSSRGSIARARTSCSLTPIRSMSRQASRQWTASSSTTFS